VAASDERRKLRFARRAATVATPVALTAAASAAAPTKVEFDKVVADNVAIRAKLADLIQKLKDAGIVA
jgi:hypothetical protein